MKSNVERARKALADTRLKAPFAGVVARIAVENFETVQAKQTILMLENNEIFKVTANIPERDAARLEPGVSLEERTRRTNPLITISAIEGRSFAARLTELATAADPTTRTFAATLSFDNPGDVNLASGMTANVRFHIPSDDKRGIGIFVPFGAVSSNADGDPIVWVVDRETMVAAGRTVQIGMLSQGRVRVKQGLSGDEWIAISGVNFLHDGMIVSRLIE